MTRDRRASRGGCCRWRREQGEAREAERCRRDEPGDAQPTVVARSAVGWPLRRVERRERERGSSVRARSAAPATERRRRPRRGGRRQPRGDGRGERPCPATRPRAVRAPRAGRRSRACRPREPAHGRKETFELGYAYAAPGAYTIRVRVLSGGCGKRQAAALGRARRRRADPRRDCRPADRLAWGLRCARGRARTRLPAPRTWTSAGAGCSSSAPTSSAATRTPSSRWPRSRARRGSPRRCSTTTSRASRRSSSRRWSSRRRSWRALVDVDPALPPVEQLARALDAFLGWVEGNAEGYGKLLEGADDPCRGARARRRRARADGAADPRRPRAAPRRRRRCAPR